MYILQYCCNRIVSKMFNLPSLYVGRTLAVVGNAQEFSIVDGGKFCSH